MKSRVPECCTDVGTRWCKFDYVTMTFVEVDPKTTSDNGWLLVTTIDEPSLVDGSSSFPIEWQLEASEEPVTNIVFLNEDGTLTVYDFSKLRGRWSLAIKDGLINVIPEGFSATLSKENTPVLCSAVENLLGVVKLKDRCISRVINKFSVKRLPKCCCPDLVPGDVTVGYGNESPTITVTSSLSSVTYGDTGPVFTAVVEGAVAEVTWSIVSGDGTLTALTELTVRYNPAETDEGNTIEVKAVIDSDPTIEDSDTCDVDAAESADEFVAFRFSAGDLMQLTTGTEDLVDYLTTEDGKDQTIVLDWDYDPSPFPEVTFSGSAGSTTRVLGLILSFNGLVSDVDLSAALGYPSETTFCTATTISHTGGALGTVGQQGQILAVQTENYIINLKLQVTGVSTVGYIVSIFNLSTFVTTDSSVYPISDSLSHIIGITIESLAVDGFTLRLYNDANMDEEIVISGTDPLGAVTGVTPLPGGGDSSNGIEVAWDETFHHQPKASVLGFNA